MAIVTSVSKPDRPLKSRKKRIIRKVGQLRVKREWQRMPEPKKRRRLITLMKLIMNACPECGEQIGDNWQCKTCVASLPELTPEEKQYCEDAGKRIFERIKPRLEALRCSQQQPE